MNFVYELMYVLTLKFRAYLKLFHGSREQKHLRILLRMYATSLELLCQRTALLPSARAMFLCFWSN